MSESISQEYGYYNYLTRTDQSMIPNSGVYKIVWSVDKCGWDYCHVGLCTDYYNDRDTCGDTCGKWLNTQYYIGWHPRRGGGSDGSNSSSSNKHGLLLGNQVSDKSIFRMTKFEGKMKILPSFSSGDKICLIYNSDKKTLEFGKNDQILDCTVRDLPKNQNFYWCVAGAGTYSGDCVLSIVDHDESSS